MTWEPGEPLCKASHGGPCPFWTRCPDERRRLMHYAELTEFRCWAYGQNFERTRLRVA